MSVLDVVFLAAAVLAVVDLLRTRGQALTSWAALLIAAGLLWSRNGG